MRKNDSILNHPLFYFLGALVLAFVLTSVVITRWLWPVEWSDAAPRHLSGVQQEDYLRMVIQSYSLDLDAARAISRYNDLGEAADDTLARIQANPADISPVDVDAFTALVTGSPPVPVEPYPINPLWMWLGGLLALLILVVTFVVLVRMFNASRETTAEPVIAPPFRPDSLPAQGDEAVTAYPWAPTSAAEPLFDETELEDTSESKAVKAAALAGAAVLLAEEEAKLTEEADIAEELGYAEKIDEAGLAAELEALGLGGAMLDETPSAESDAENVALQDWLQELGDAELPTLDGDADTLGVLGAAGLAAALEAETPAEADTTMADSGLETPDWLADLETPELEGQETDLETGLADELAVGTAEGDLELPDWLADLENMPGEEAAADTLEAAEDSAASPLDDISPAEAAIFTAGIAGAAAVEESAEEGESDLELPEWLKEFEEGGKEDWGQDLHAAEIPPLSEPGVDLTGAIDQAEMSKFTFDLDYLEMIGFDRAEKLHAVGVHTPLNLLEQGATPAGRQELADRTGIDAGKIAQWVDQVDLYRVPGLDGETADLLTAAGVDSLPKLAESEPADLLAKLTRTNQDKRLVRTLPAITEVMDWVERAKKLPRVVSYSD